MLNITRCSTRDVRRFAHQIYREHITSEKSFESTAQAIVQAIFNEFIRPDGSPLFGLLRIFRFAPRTQVPPEWMNKVDPDINIYLALAGTMGIEDNWCIRTKSQHRQVVPADSTVPSMIRAVFDQLGLRFGDSVETDLEIKRHEQSLLTRYFHIQHAAGSPYVPEQENFVERYGIKSMFGIGTVFVDGSTAYLMIGFTLEEIGEEEARKLSELIAFVGTALAARNEGVIWDS